MKYKILAKEGIFPETICLKGQFIKESYAVYPTGNFKFIKTFNNTQTLSQGEYITAKEMQGAGVSYFDVLPYNDECKKDFENNFFDDDKCLCPIT